MTRVMGLIVLALLGLASEPALAVQGAPIAYARADNSTLTSSTTVGLTAGQDYLLEADGFGTVELVIPQGQTAITLQPHMDYPSVVQPFRAAYTAVYGVRATYNPDAPPGFENVPVQTWLYQDCRSDTHTKCRLGLTNTQHGFIVSMGDRDWYGVTLRKGIRYRLTIATSGGQASLTLRSPAGELLVRHIAPDGGTALIDYKAPSAGTYFAAVSLVTQANIHYDLSIQRP